MLAYQPGWISLLGIGIFLCVLVKVFLMRLIFNFLEHHIH